LRSGKYHRWAVKPTFSFQDSEAAREQLPDNAVLKQLNKTHVKVNQCKTVGFGRLPVLAIGLPSLSLKTPFNTASRFLKHYL